MTRSLSFSMRVLAPLTLTGVLLACADAQGPTPEPTGSASSAESVATASRLRGVLRPPSKMSFVPEAKVAPTTGSYAPTGGCGTALSYYGGPVIADPIVVQVSWNDPTSAVPTATENYLKSWWPAIISTQANYLSLLGEYSTVGKNGTDGQPGSNQTFSGHATYGNLFHITPSAANQGGTIDDTAIGPEIVAQINAGHLPQPTYDSAGHCQTIYMIDFPPAVTDISMTFAGATIHSCTDFCGYHAGTTFSGSKVIYYGVHPDMTSTCNANCVLPADGLQADMGLIHSHELAEAMTDAEIFQEPLTSSSTDFVRPGGWDQIASGCSEIGDSCAWPSQAGAAIPTVMYNGVSYPVQGLFDNATLQCQSSGPVVAGCTTDATCANPTPACKAGSCAACTSTQDCAGSPSGSVCDTSNGWCVQCTSGAQCSGSTPICDGTSFTCRACQATDCSGATPYCDATSGTCVACEIDANCPTSQPICDTTNHTCRGCTGNPDCATMTNHACDTQTGLCVACMQTTDCVSGVCDTTTHTCVQCVDDSECMNPSPVCSPSAHTCGPCGSNADCATNSHGHVCMAGSCVPGSTGTDAGTGNDAGSGGHDGGTGNHDGGTTGNDGGVGPGQDSGSGSSDDAGGTGDDGGSTGGGGDGGSGHGTGGSGGGCSVGSTGSDAGTASTLGLGFLALLGLARRRRNAADRAQGA